MPDGEWHEVAQGEWLTKIAADHGISKWETIWNHPENAALRGRRDPDILYPGDMLFIPLREIKEEQGATDKRHKFQLKRQWDTFELDLLDAAGKPIARQKYVLRIGSQEFRGVTNGKGHLRQERVDPAGDHTGTLEFPDEGLVFAIEVGGMNPAHEGGGKEQDIYDDGISGIQMRLANLGYDPGPLDGIYGPLTRAALAQFQTFEMKRGPEAATGKLDAGTRQALLSKHSS
jgi:hypothetical protein